MNTDSDNPDDDTPETGDTEHVSALQATVSTVWVRSAALSGILFLMVLYTMYFAASLVMPLVLALLLSLVLTPLVRFLVRLRIPQALAALMVMLSLTGVMASSVYTLSTPATEWLERAPYELRLLEYKLAWVKEPIKKVQEAKEEIDRLTQVEPDNGSEGDGENANNAEGGMSISLVDSVLRRTPNFIYGTAVMLILLFFILASGDSFLNKVVHITASFADKRRVVRTAREIQRQVAVYLGTVTVINIAVGVAVALAMYLLQVPNPLLWGVMVGVLNFIPYLGVVISMVVVTFVSMLTFDTALQMLLPALAIFAVNVVEGQFLTPIITGRRLSLSPVAVFLSIAVLGWMWGLIGVLIAVPTLATIKLVCEQITPLKDVAVLLGR